MRLTQVTLPIVSAFAQVTSFWEKYWEKGPYYRKADKYTAESFPSLFDEGFLSGASTESGLSVDDLDYGHDVIAARCQDGLRQTLETLNGKVSCVIGDGWTLQIHQPQRFIENLWRICASMESELGCLVGCNAYVTPPGAQGLAPHYDDVSIFCCQVHGKKAWKIYKAEPPLANHPSGDLQAKSLGKAFMEIEMSPGDVLYLPRGVVHEAQALEESSTHLTISFLQKWSWADLIGKAVEALTSLPPLQVHMPLKLKSSLPVFDTTKETLQQGLNDALLQLVDHIRNDDSGMIAMNAMNAMAYDFMQSRLPPHPDQIPDKGSSPSLDDEVALLGKFFHLFRDLNGEMKTSASKSTKGTVEFTYDNTYDLRVISSLHNSRESHMISAHSCSDSLCCSSSGDDDDISEDTSSDEEVEDGEATMILPQSFEPVLMQIFSGKPIKVREFAGLAEDDIKAQIAKTLWSFGLVKTIKSSAKRQKRG